MWGFLKSASSIDESLRRLSKFLNRKWFLFLQTALWSFVACFCIAGHDFKDERLKNILLCAFAPPIYLIPLGFILIFFQPSISSTIAKIFVNHQHVYKFLVSFVEVIIMWLITLVKPHVYAQEGSLSFILLTVSLYFLVVTFCELLRIVDRGSINGAATVIILVMEKRFKFLSLPVTTALVFWKSLLSADCCDYCRARKLIEKEAEEQERKRLMGAIIGGQYPTTRSGAFGG